MKQRLDFKKRSNSKEGFYDLREDWALIEASLAKQYGIRIRSQADMPWDEFCVLVSGLMADTPLGQVVSVRAEKDSKTIKQFNSDQKKIYLEWKKRRMVSLQESEFNLEMDNLEKSMEIAFGKREVNKNE